MSEFLSEASSFLWGTPLLVFLLGANIILLFHSKLLPILGIKHALKLVSGKHESKDDKAEGQITHFQALSNALAATIGLGNIAGVAVAITQGGAGAIFWMWISALLGMNTKFFECTLAVMFRGKDYKGEVQGGPMYYIEKGMPAKYKFLALFFAICGLVGTFALFQMNQMASFLETSYSVKPIVTGSVIGIVVAYILFGGLSRISKFTSSIVPLMSALYFILCMIIVLMNYDKVPVIISSIIGEALGFKQVAGGVSGFAIMHIIQTGVKRAAFSNEAGIGTAPMAHGNVKTSEPISEGYVAMLGPLIDTLIVCTLTALTILIGVENLSELGGDVDGINLTALAFTNSYGVYGKHALAIIVFMFAFSTMIGMANYNKKCWDYIFKGRSIMNEKTFVVFYCASLVFGAMATMGSVVDLIDVCYALMAIPNIIATVYLAKHVKKSLKKYNEENKV